MRTVPRRALIALCSFVAALGAGAPAASADTVPAGRPLDWQTCTEDGWECATATVPKVYGQPWRGDFTLAVTRLPAADQENKIGSVFVNYGGPGASAVDITQAIGSILFGAFHERFDIVAFDPRGTGATSQAIDCQANQETEGVYSKPFPTPENLDVRALLGRIDSYFAKCQRLNRGVLAYTATANYARDMNRLRRSVGDERLTYFGFSYGTFIGETYAALFPNRMRALVLDGALNPDMYINRPMAHLRAQTAAFERALGRFFQACAAHQDVCTFGGEDPHQAFDDLVERADRSPIPAGGEDPRPVTGEDILFGSFGPLYSKFAWPDLAAALNDLAAGDGTRMREMADGSWGRNPDGTYSPANDRYLLLSAEQRYTRKVRTYLEAGEDSWTSFDHFWWNTGYVELYWARIPVEAQGAYYGPFDVPGSASGTPLVIGTTFDPATPYREARRAVAQMGNARLLTMRGDGHTAYFNGSQCIDDTVNAYVLTRALPPQGTTCQQEVPFPLPEMAAKVAPEANTGAGLERGFAGRGTAPFRPAR